MHMVLRMRAHNNAMRGRCHKHNSARLTIRTYKELNYMDDFADDY